MNSKNDQTQGIILNVTDDDAPIAAWINAFLLDRQVRNLSGGSLEFYRKKLGVLLKYCDAHSIVRMSQLNANVLRQFMLYLQDTAHNPGGIHTYFRAFRALLYWYEIEAEPENWKNPISKIQGPIRTIEPLDPAEISSISAMIGTCDKKFTGVRDKAIMLALLDTGARANELLNINLADINIVSGDIQIRQGKGRKPRFVLLGIKSRKAVRAYLKMRRDALDALWIRDDAEGRLGYDALRAIITRRAALAGIKPPSLHSFRRAFALNMLRSGTDLMTIATLLGHTSLAVMNLYIKPTKDDIAAIYSRVGGPVDRNL